MVRIEKITFVQLVWYYLVQVLILTRGSQHFIRQNRICLNNVFICAVILSYLLFISVPTFTPVWFFNFIKCIID